MDDSELKTAFETDLGALEQSGALMPMSFTPRQAWRLLGILQTVVLLRLADSPDDDKYARELAANIEGRLCKTPAMKEMAERGKAGHPSINSAPPTEDESAVRSPSALDTVLRSAKPEPKPAKRVTKRR